MQSLDAAEPAAKGTMTPLIKAAVPSQEQRLFYLLPFEGMKGENRNMKRLTMTGTIIAIAMTAMANSAAFAAIIEIGTGQNVAGLYIEWGDGYTAEFAVRFETPTVTGLQIFDIIEANTSLATTRGDFGWGVFIDGLTYDGHSDIGYNGGEYWWHYWNKNNGQSWESSWTGVADRILSNGDTDGWIYGHAGAPAPEPATFILFSIAALLVRKNAK